MAVPFAPRPSVPYDPDAARRRLMDQNLDRLWTAEELPFYEGRCELVDGRIVPLTPPGEAHGRIGFRVALALGRFVEDHGLGVCYLAETGFLLGRNPDTVRAPDAAFVAGERRVATASGYVESAPDVVVEVRSPSETRADAVRKARLWIAAGARTVWNVDPERRVVDVYDRESDGAAASRTLSVGDDLDGGAALPGFRLPVSAIFRPDD
jgi:Uma2 family endonuclease